MKTKTAFSFFSLFLLHCVAQQVPLEMMLPSRPVVTLVSGEDLYDSSTTLPEFKTYLETHFPIECRYLRYEDKNNLPGLEVLEKTDLLVLFARRTTLKSDQLARIKSYLQSGRPMVALRTSSHAFENWIEFDREVLGGNYHGHFSNDQFPAIALMEDQVYHPILDGFRPFVSNGSLYKNNPLPAASTVLLTGKIEDEPSEPVAWVHEYGSSRVFYTSLGHPEDFKLVPFRNLIVNAVYWAMNQPTSPVPVEEGEPKRVDVEEFESLMTSHEAIVLDVRTPGEFESGHMPGAVNVDFNGPDFKGRIANLDKKQLYLIHCRSGGRSKRASDLFRELGFTRVYDLAPGIFGWEKAGKPIDK